MKQLTAIVLLLLAVLRADCYKVAVVEYHREVQNGFDENIKHNLKNYLKIVTEIVNNNENMDLIAFPESTLVFPSTFFTKDVLLQHASELPDDNATIPCSEPSVTSFYVRELSCASIKHNVYLSVNFIEKTPANELFNTNIVIDRHGRIVSRYRKMNVLAIEPYLSSGSEVSTFHTDFGVTFGVFTCFDIFFRDAFQKSLDNGVKAFIFPSYWYSELPFLSSVQVQRMWSYLHKSVLIASGGNNIRTGTSGSGIYAGRNNVYASYLTNTTRNKVMVAEIPQDLNELPSNEKDGGQHVRELTNFVFTEKRPKMHVHDVSRRDGVDDTICDGAFCCRFKVKASSMRGLVLAIYNGRQAFIGFGELGIQLCAVVQCEDGNCFTIPAREHFEKTFDELEVQVVNATSGSDYYPNVALQDLHFLPVDRFTFADEQLHLQLTNATEGIYTFGFYGRHYENDE